MSRAASPRHNRPAGAGTPTRGRRWCRAGRRSRPQPAARPQRAARRRRAGASGRRRSPPASPSRCRTPPGRAWPSALLLPPWHIPRCWAGPARRAPRAAPAACPDLQASTRRTATVAIAVPDSTKAPRSSSRLVMPPVPSSRRDSRTSPAIAELLRPSRRALAARPRHGPPGRRYPRCPHRVARCRTRPHPSR